MFPSAVSHIVNDGYKESKVKGLVEQGCNILPVSFHRETEAYISLRAFFKFGKLFFRIRRTDDFINYLIEYKIDNKIEDLSEEELSNLLNSFLNEYIKGSSKTKKGI